MLTERPRKKRRYTPRKRKGDILPACLIHPQSDRCNIDAIEHQNCLYRLLESRDGKRLTAEDTAKYVQMSSRQAVQWTEAEAKKKLYDYFSMYSPQSLEELLSLHHHGERYRVTKRIVDT